MRVIIAGSRNIVPWLGEINIAVKKCGWQITTVLSGTARGGDRVGEAWARKNKIKIERYPANWKKFPRTAGFMRNAEMANNADALIALWDGESVGTGDMIGRMRAKGLPVHIEYTI